MGFWMVIVATMTSDFLSAMDLVRTLSFFVYVATEARTHAIDGDIYGFTDNRRRSGWL